MGEFSSTDELLGVSVPSKPSANMKTLGLPTPTPYEKEKRPKRPVRRFRFGSTYPRELESGSLRETFMHTSHIV